MRKLGLIFSLFVIVSSNVYPSSDNQLKTVQYYQEDINKDGVIEAVKVVENTTAAYLVRRLVVTRKNEVVLKTEWIQHLSGGKLIVQDLTDQFLGKEILVVQPHISNNTETGQYQLYWYGWKKDSNLYSLYNQIITRHKYKQDSFNLIIANENIDKSGTVGENYYFIKCAWQLLDDIKSGNHPYSQKDIEFINIKQDYSLIKKTLLSQKRLYVQFCDNEIWEGIKTSSVEIIDYSRNYYSKELDYVRNGPIDYSTFSFSVKFDKNGKIYQLEPNYLAIN